MRFRKECRFESDRGHHRPFCDRWLSDPESDLSTDAYGVASPPTKSTSGTPADALFQRLLVDHESLTASIRAGESDFAAGFEGLSTSYAVVRADALSGAVLDRAGRVLRATSTFAADLGLEAGAPSIFDIGFDLDGPTIQLVHPSMAGVLSGLAVTTPAGAAGWKLRR